MISFVIQETPIFDKMLLENKSNEGARLIFVGLVRDYNQNKSGVSKIEYHCYNEMAEQEGLKILQAAKEKFQVERIVCVHRVGALNLQEVAIRLEIGSGHREASLRACEFIMDEIKQHIPIWKKEYYKGDLLEEEGEWL